MHLLPLSLRVLGTFACECWSRIKSLRVLVTYKRKDTLRRVSFRWHAAGCVCLVAGLSLHAMPVSHVMKCVSSAPGFGFYATGPPPKKQIDPVKAKAKARWKMVAKFLRPDAGAADSSDLKAVSVRRHSSFDLLPILKVLVCLAKRIRCTSSEHIQ